MIKSLKIGAVLKFSTLDYPGKLSAVIFCQGCSNHCIYCHNPDFIPILPTSSIDFSKVLNFLKTRRGLLDAVVFSGGEPLIQEGLSNAIEQVKSLRFLTGLHTSGVNPKMLKKIVDQIDWIGFDIKTVFAKYETITRNKMSGKLAEESLDIILQSDIPHEIRTTVDSRYITMDDLQNIASMLNRKGIGKWVLQECILRDDDNEKKLSLPNEDEIKLLRQFVEVEIRRQ